ncbi:MAG: YbbR-like domain-containing protein [Candidatus Latescibacterota bacterium]|nr:YbbR-like domain-containing protein [Candidatus Latescibacterota bacterium]
MKLGAGVLAAFVWFHAVTEFSYQREVEIALEVQEPVVPPAGVAPLVVANRLPNKVTVAVFGKGKDLLALRASDLVLRLRPQQGRASSRLSLRLTPDLVESHSDLDVAIEHVVTPTTLEVVLDRRIERVVPVRPCVRLQLADSYTKVGPVHVEPESIRVSGPRRDVQGIEAIITDSLVSENAADYVEQEVALIPPPDRMVTLSRDRVTISVDIQELAEYEIPNVPVALNDAPPGAQVEPSRVTVRVKGGADLLIPLLDAEGDLGLVVDYSRWQSQSEDAGIVEPPADRLYEVVEIRPERVAVVSR